MRRSGLEQPGTHVSRFDLPRGKIKNKRMKNDKKINNGIKRGIPAVANLAWVLVLYDQTGQRHEYDVAIPR